MIGEPVPIEAERGYHVGSDPALQLPMPVHVPDAKVFVTPMEMGVRIATGRIRRYLCRAQLRACRRA